LVGYAKLLKKSKKATVGVFPPACYLPLAKELLKGKAVLGGQNCYWEEGAFTGEISPAQLKGSGCGYVIVGHSERRHKFGETNAVINKKVKAALVAGLVPVFCCGETREERIAGKITEIVEAQIREGLAEIDLTAQKIIIAYEPVWAIGTGQACSPKEADVVRQYIRNITNDKISLLYGGSVKSDNCASYLVEAGFDGFLVGGASLDAREFSQIAQAAL
jgi:triosephosphate isomerase